MEAKDTVITFNAWGMTELQKQKVETALSEQAEISFKAGVREVVDFIWGYISGGVSDGFYVGISHSKWQTKLEEWGISP